jgi:hypothetical protein
MLDSRFIPIIGAILSCQVLCTGYSEAENILGFYCFSFFSSVKFKGSSTLEQIQFWLIIPSRG